MPKTKGAEPLTWPQLYREHESAARERFLKETAIALSSLQLASFVVLGLSFAVFVKTAYQVRRRLSELAGKSPVQRKSEPMVPPSPQE